MSFGEKVKGFTLIELLIVVAIIAILAAIAVPNFLEAQTRSKVSRVKADMRTVATALEAYCVDNSSYPVKTITSTDNRDRGGLQEFSALSTPVAYLSSTELADPFAAIGANGMTDPNNSNFNSKENICYVNVIAARKAKGWSAGHTVWALCSYGPDKGRGPFPGGDFPQNLLGNYRGTKDKDPAEIGGGYCIYSTYDASNGTRSGGDILRWPGGGR